MAKVILGLVLVLFLLTPANAQEQQSADEIVQKMAVYLNLTPEQVSAVKPIIEDNIAKSQELLNNTTDRGSIKEQLVQLKQDENQKLVQVLTPDQMSKLDSMRTQHHHETQQHR